MLKQGSFTLEPDNDTTEIMVSAIIGGVTEAVGDQDHEDKVIIIYDERISTAVTDELVTEESAGEDILELKEEFRTKQVGHKLDTAIFDYDSGDI